MAQQVLIRQVCRQDQEIQEIRLRLDFLPVQLLPSIQGDPLDRTDPLVL